MNTNKNEMKFHSCCAKISVLKALQHNILPTYTDLKVSLNLNYNKILKLRECSVIIVIERFPSKKLMNIKISCVRN
jgi:hypothetical protein